MYDLYFSPGACSLAFHTMLREVGAPFQLINKADVPEADYAAINPTGTVPVLKDGDHYVREGAAIALAIAEAFPTDLLPVGAAGTNAREAMLFANASVHPAYSKLFFLAFNLEDGPVKTQALELAAARVAKLWAILDQTLETSAYVAGDALTIADIMLTVYANWGQFFPVDIPLGKNVQRVIADVTKRPAFQEALAAEGVTYKAAA
ncbi:MULTISPECIES: glutathione S-transferase family protein [Kordiimonas]|jgi:glutathione S-transferase|uniref:glutathione S-transferase family protein n=1 Tax=Kordiimonas TaxID=288021 RepID=UPI00257CC12D|nr:glutathione S-transferase family protein [Kordiimonas sp. UBA4487]